MGNPFEALELRLAAIEQHLISLNNILIRKDTGERNQDSLDVHEVAKILKLSVATVYTKTHKKTIPHRKEGKKLLFSLHEIENYLASNKVKTVKEEILDNNDFISKRLSTKKRLVIA